MRIGVDATCWLNRRGYGRFARQLLTAVLALDRNNEYVFFVDDQSEEFPFPEHDVELVRIPVDVPTAKAASANGRRSLKALWAVSRAISRQRLDAFFFPSVYSYVPLLRSLPSAVTIHDAIPKLFPELVFPTLRSKLFWWAKVELACAQARLVLTISEYSRRCLVKYMKIAPARIRVVNEASSPVFQRLAGSEGRARLLMTRLGIPTGTRLIVYVGGFSPHKNLALLMEVFQELQAQPRFADLRLVLVGDYEGDVFYSCYRTLVDQIKQAGLGGQVFFTGHLSDADLVLLLNLAEVLVLPSFSEGFGLPAVEAAACGTPVVATTESPLAELLGEGIIAVQPRDSAGWRDAISRVLTEPGLRARMREGGLAAAGRLSWQHSAQQLLSVLNELVDHRESPA